MKRFKKELYILNRFLIFVFALIVFLFVTFNQSIQQNTEKSTVENQVPAQGEDEQIPGAQFSFISSAAITPAFSLGITVANFIVFNFIVEQDTYIKEVDAVSTYINMYLKTLFSRIISPNAP